MQQKKTALTMLLTFIYGSDADAALSAGKDARHGLIGAGVYASHGYERSHKDGVVNTFRLLCSYLNGDAPKMD